MKEGRTFWPAGGETLTSPGASHCFGFVPVIRTLWNFGDAATFGSISNGPLAQESVAVINCLMTSAANHNVKIYWETVYSKDVEEWERVCLSLANITTL